MGLDFGVVWLVGWLVVGVVLVGFWLGRIIPPASHPLVLLCWRGWWVGVFLSLDSFLIGGV